MEYIIYYALKSILMDTFVQVVKMFVFVIGIFGICWLPYHVYFIYSYHDPDITRLLYLSTSSTPTTP